MDSVQPARSVHLFVSLASCHWSVLGCYFLQVAFRVLIVFFISFCFLSLFLTWLKSGFTFKGDLFGVPVLAAAFLSLNPGGGGGG